MQGSPGLWSQAFSSRAPRLHRFEADVRMWRRRGIEVTSGPDPNQ
jgi:hypothetical protein